MKVAITGATGFVGKHLVKKCSDLGYEVSVLSRQQFGPSHDLTSDTCDLSSFLKDCDVVFHCAGEINNPEKMRALHVDGTQRLINAVKEESLRKNKKIHFVHLSSCGVYGPAQNNEERIVTESTPPNPVGEYEVTKYLSDEIVIKEASTNLFTYSILRPSNIYGKDMPNGSLRSLGKMISKGLFFYIGRKDAVGTYIHINDVVEALVKCAIDLRAKNQVYNLSNDGPLSDVIEGMAEALKVSSPTRSMPLTFAKIISKIPGSPLTPTRINALRGKTKYSTAKIERDLSFNPQLSTRKHIGEVF